MPLADFCRQRYADDPHVLAVVELAADLGEPGREILRHLAARHAEGDPDFEDRWYPEA